MGQILPSGDCTGISKEKNCSPESGHVGTYTLLFLCFVPFSFALTLSHRFTTCLVVKGALQHKNIKFSGKLKYCSSGLILKMRQQEPQSVPQTIVQLAKCWRRRR